MLAFEIFMPKVFGAFFVAPSRRPSTHTSGLEEEKVHEMLQGAGRCLSGLRPSGKDMLDCTKETPGILLILTLMARLSESLQKGTPSEKQKMMIKSEICV